MPVYLKDIKKELKQGMAKAGKGPDGNYKSIPPNFVARDIKKYSQLKVTKVTKTARPGINALSFTALVSSESEPGMKYKVSIYFHNMKFKEIESTAFNQKSPVASLSAKRRKTVWHRTPSAQRNPVTLKCSCQDFRHRFETQLAKANGLLGAPRKYVRKTPAWPVGRPYANATNKLGICKHIHSVLMHLYKKGEVKER